MTGFADVFYAALDAKVRAHEDRMRREGMASDLRAMAERAEFDRRDETQNAEDRYRHWCDCWALAGELQERS